MAASTPARLRARMASDEVRLNMSDAELTEVRELVSRLQRTDRNSAFANLQEFRTEPWILIPRQPLFNVLHAWLLVATSIGGFVGWRILRGQLAPRVE